MEGKQCLDGAPTVRVFAVKSLDMKEADQMHERQQRLKQQF